MRPSSQGRSGPVVLPTLPGCVLLSHEGAVVVDVAGRPLPPPQPAQLEQEQLTVGQIVAILAAGLAAQKTLELLSKTLKPLGIGPAAVKAAWTISGKRQRRLRRANAARFRAPRGANQLRRPGQGITSLHPERTAALTATLAGEDMWQATYLYASSQRLQQAVDAARRQGGSQAQALRDAMDRERQYHAQHLDAQQRRRQAAAQVDVAALRHGVPYVDGVTGRPTRLVGWHAKLDAKTSKECRLADGNNFPANRPPSIGYPGAVHPACRCRPGAPHANGQLLDSIITTRRAA
jgi:hypothetical protein